jgi:acyl-lipid omega-6 desaturase (Delta-12 desaturase)
MKTLTKETALELVAITRKYQWTNMKKASLQLITSILPYIGLWIVMYLLMDSYYRISLILAVPAALFLLRIFVVQHDCGHQSFFKSKKLNDFWWRICSYLIFLPYSYWAKSHQFHHNHTWLLFELRDLWDIHTLTVDEYTKLSSRWKLKYRIWRNPISLFIVGPLYYFLIHIHLPTIALPGWSKARRNNIIHLLFLVLLYSILGYVLGRDVLWKVQLPIMFFFTWVSFWLFYVQHQHEETYKQWKDKWDQLVAAVKWSSYYKLPRVWHWLSWNIWYHHIHHLNSFVPSYALARCHNDNPMFEIYIKPLTIKDSLSCIWNHLWDESQQRMVSFAYVKKHYLKW